MLGAFLSQTQDAAGREVGHSFPSVFPVLSLLTLSWPMPFELEVLTLLLDEFTEAQDHISGELTVWDSTQALFLQITKEP